MKLLFAGALSAVHLAVVPGAVAPGAAVKVVGNAGTCPAGNVVTAISAAFPGHAFGMGTLTGRVVTGGAFTIRGHVRKGLKAGRYTVTARCGGGNFGVTAFVRIR
ncbi:MAG TPA: hypothetical protein VHD91_04890 [Gaiellaceae bacterium]|nr:hypothetical protein [Gaiellaceae bacterium]